MKHTLLATLTAAALTVTSFGAMALNNNDKVLSFERDVPEICGVKLIDGTAKLALDDEGFSDYVKFTAFSNERSALASGLVDIKVDLDFDSGIDELYNDTDLRDTIRVDNAGDFKERRGNQDLAYEFISVENNGTMEVAMKTSLTASQLPGGEVTDIEVTISVNCFD